MANFSVLVALLFLHCSLSSSSSSSSAFPLKPKQKTPTIASAPTILPDHPPMSPVTQLSPDIAPLLPSPGSGSGSSMPTIPSNPSTNPDEVSSVGPDPAFAPSVGFLQASSSAMQHFRDSIALLSSLGFVSLWLGTGC